MNEYPNITLKISHSGRIMQLYAMNGRLICEVLVHGSLNSAAFNAVENLAIVNGRVNVYRGEMHQISGHEILDVEKEYIIEKEDRLK